MLVSLGVPNDDNHIIWNQEQQSVTVRNNNIEIYLKLNDTAAKVNGRAVTLDVPLVAYKNRTYIPARFVSEALNMKVAWDGRLKTVYITDMTVFEQTKEALDKCMAAMKNIKDVTYSVSYDVKKIVESESSPSTENFVGTASVRSDFLTEVTHFKDHSAPDKPYSTVETYYTNNLKYTKMKYFQWQKVDISDYASIFKYKVSSPYKAMLLDLGMINCFSSELLGDAQYTGLKVNDLLSDESTLVLEGGVLFEDAYNMTGFVSTRAERGMLAFYIIGDGDSKSCKVTLRIDRNTNRLKTLEADVSASIVYWEGESVTFNGKIKYEYLNYDAGLNLTVPEEVRNGATSDIFPVPEDGAV